MDVSFPAIASQPFVVARVSAATPAMLAAVGRPSARRGAKQDPVSLFVSARRVSLHCLRVSVCLRLLFRAPGSLPRRRVVCFRQRPVSTSGGGGGDGGGDAPQPSARPTAPTKTTVLLPPSAAAAAAATAAAARRSPTDRPEREVSFGMRWAAGRTPTTPKNKRPYQTERKEQASGPVGARSRGRRWKWWNAMAGMCGRTVNTTRRFISFCRHTFRTPPLDPPTCFRSTI